MIIGVGCSYGLRLLAIERLFEHALDEVLQLVTVAAGVDFEPPVKVSSDLESRGRDWRWWSSGHSGKICAL